MIVHVLATTSMIRMIATIQGMIFATIVLGMRPTGIAILLL